MQNYLGNLSEFSGIMTKSIANRTIPAVDLGFIINPDLPVISLSMDVYETKCAEKHCHPRAQLIYSSEGTMKVVVKDKMWLVSSRQAIWVPSMLEHQVYFLKSNHIRNLFIDPSVANRLPNACFAIDVSPWLKELVLKAVSIGCTYDMDSPNGRIITVLLDELATIKPTKCFLPVSDNLTIRKVIDVLLQNPGDERSMEEFASIACITPRTLSRLFSKELGLSFHEWRKQVRLLEAIIRLEKGHSIKEISFELGYNSPSAFIEMFRKWFGISPGKYAETNKIDLV
jgi:AraC-like DNA-binding protein